MVLQQDWWWIKIWFGLSAFCLRFAMQFALDLLFLLLRSLYFRDQLMHSWFSLSYELWHALTKNPGDYFQLWIWGREGIGLLCTWASAFIRAACTVSQLQSFPPALGGFIEDFKVLVSIPIKIFVFTISKLELKNTLNKLLAGFSHIFSKLQHNLIR